MKKIILLIALFINLVSCNSEPNPNYLGRVDILPKGAYTLQNSGSRHMVKCVREDGKYYYLCDTRFKENGINAWDASQFYNLTYVMID